MQHCIFHVIKLHDHNINIFIRLMCGVVFICGKTSDLFIFNYSSTTNTKNNKNYIQIRRPPSDDYKHRTEPKARRCHHPSLGGTEQNFL